MAYDFHGAWEQITGHHAPLYKHPKDQGDLALFNVVSFVVKIDNIHVAKSYFFILVDFRMTAFITGYRRARLEKN